MKTIDIDTNIRDRYFKGDLFKIGDIVLDLVTEEQVKILDRGANYITVATSSGNTKKWLNEVAEVIINPAETLQENEQPSEFLVTVEGQLQLFGYETKAFDQCLSELMVEQFSEFDDLYAKHQIVKRLDLALLESNADTGFQLLAKLEELYSKHDLQCPYIVEAKKNDFERRKIIEILASVAGVNVLDSNTQTLNEIIKTFKTKYKTRQQWDVLNPFFDVAYSFGLTTAKQNLPFTSNEVTEEFTDNIMFEVFDDNIDMIVEDLEIEDIVEAFEDSEFCDDVSEGLSIETRMKLGRKMKQREQVLDVRRERAMTRAASTNVLLARARRLAETMLKRRMFKKSVGDLTRQEKERFESGAFKRRAIVARLAQKLVSKVRMLQSARLHHTPSAPVQQSGAS